MPTYIALVQYTQDGIRAIKESPKRLEDARKVFEAGGAKLKEFYLVMGQYDIVIVAEAPDDDTMAKVTLNAGSKGKVRTQTMRAFTEPEFRKIVGSLP